MALPSGALFEIRDTATTANVNGAGFNPANANFLTNLTTDAGTGNTSAPVVSSASYNFVAGDVGAWVYIQSGTNWTPGFYQIASVATNKATLSAAIGAASQLNALTNLYGPSTVAGCATVGTPTGGVFGVDYSQQDTAQATATDYAAVGASTTLTSASGAFTRVMVGNFYHQTTTGTGAFGVVGWYEIVNYTNATTVTLDRTPNSGTASVACTGFVGGAGRLNGLEDPFLEMIPAGSTVFIKSGTYTLSGAVTVASTNSTALLPSNIYGYFGARGIIPSTTQLPVFAVGSNALTWGTYQRVSDLFITGTTGGSGPTIIGTNASLTRCKVVNNSSTVGRSAVTMGTDSLLLASEITCQNGTAVSATITNSRIFGCYIHDSVTGISTANNTVAFISNCVVEACSTSAIVSTATLPAHTIINNTIYGRESQMGLGLDFSGANSAKSKVFNNIFYGLSTGISVATGKGSNYSLANNFFNNTTNVTNWDYDATDVFLNPAFTNASQITGTTATTAGSVLTDATANFSGVTDNVDYVRIVSGTGTTIGNYLITSHTTTTLTVNNALGTGATADKVYFVTNGHNFAVGAAMQAAYPGVFPGGMSTGYLDTGAVQRSGSSGSSGGSYTFVG